MDVKQIERLEALLAKATPGPWQVDGACCGEHGTETCAIYHVDESKGYRHIHEVVEAGCGCHDQAVGEDNAALIAELVNAAPALLQLARAVSEAPQARMVASGHSLDGSQVRIVGYAPVDRADYEAFKALVAETVALVPVPVKEG